jgi:hypothetical protein
MMLDGRSQIVIRRIPGPPKLARSAAKLVLDLDAWPGGRRLAQVRAQPFASWIERPQTRAGTARCASH